MFEIIEKELGRIADVLEKLADGQPAKKQRKATVKKELPPAEPVKIELVQEPEDTLGLGLGDEPVTAETVIVYTEQDIRDAAKPLVDASGKGNREGYNAAAAIIEKYGESVAAIPEEKRGLVIDELKTAKANWGK